MTCPDCNGSGKYVGLNSVEDCKTCRKPYGIALEDSKANPDGTHTVNVAVYNNQPHAKIGDYDRIANGETPKSITAYTGKPATITFWTDMEQRMLDALNAAYPDIWIDEEIPPEAQREIAQQLMAEDNAKQKSADMTKLVERLTQPTPPLAAWGLMPPDDR